MPENKRRNYGGRCRMSDGAYGLPMDSGCWFLWSQIQEVAQEAVPQERLPSARRFSLLDACALASVGDHLKQRLSLLYGSTNPSVRRAASLVTNDTQASLG